MRIRCGTSGYQYENWEGPFYPDGCNKERWLTYYAKLFDTVEINNTFYNIPSASTVNNWRESIPDDFRFSLKASRYITHMKKLSLDDELEDALQSFYKSIEPLSDKTDCILWQLPSNLHKDLRRIEGFLDRIKDRYINVFEFRHESWFDDEVMDILESRGAVYCSLSCPEEGLPDKVFTISNKVYLRMHGNESWYEGSYSEDQLKQWLNRINETDAEKVFIYFNNSKNADAPPNAQLFKNISEKNV